MEAARDNLTKLKKILDTAREYSKKYELSKAVEMAVRSEYDYSSPEGRRYYAIVLKKLKTEQQENELRIKNERITDTLKVARERHDDLLDEAEQADDLRSYFSEKRA